MRPSLSGFLRWFDTDPISVLLEGTGQSQQGCSSAQLNKRVPSS